MTHWSIGHPVLTHVVQTPLGRIGLFALPLQVQDLYVRKPEVLALSQEAVAQAQMVGARVVALTGLLPSALDYGHLLAQALSGKPRPLLTTGHATTTAAIVLNIQHLLTLTGRDLSQERVACVGLGSIGMTTLQVLLRLLPHPASLLLCDLYSHRSRLEALASELRAQGYRGDVLIGEASAGTVADAVYDATMLIGATNAANVVDVGRLAPGCLLIDDSGPHCFDPKLAWERMQRQQDLLAIEAGELRTPFAMQEQRYVPAGAVQIEHLMRSEEMIALREHAQEIMGCLVTGVISLALQVPTTLGRVQAQVSQQHYEALVRAGFGAAAPHLGNTLIPEPLLERFGAERSKGDA